MYNPIQIANYFISKSFYSGDGVDPMKLVKLVYVAHGWHLALSGKPLISEAVQAWKYGPVVPSVYRRFKHFGGSNVTRMNESFLNIDFDPELTLFLDRIWDRYLSFSGLQMSTITHQPNTPWSITWENSRGRREAIIPNDLIEKHYKSLLNGRR